MKKPIEWENQVDGKNYAFSYQKVKGKHVLTINGTPTEIKSGFKSSMLGFDEKFMLDGKEAQLVINNKVPDIAVDGVFLKSGKKYVPSPAWVVVFSILCLLIPIISLGGALPALLGCGGLALCVSVSKTSLPSAVRVILCTLITLLAWVLWFVLIISVS